MKTSYTFRLTSRRTEEFYDELIQSSENCHLMFALYPVKRENNYIRYYNIERERMKRVDVQIHLMKW